MHAILGCLGIFLTVYMGLVSSACTPRQEVASTRSLSVSGLANFTISVADTMSLAASALTYTPVASDVTVKPSARFRYAVFADAPKGPVNRHAHVIFSELPRPEWRWEKETWSRPEALSYAKDRKAGKYWTIQMFPILPSGDWFSALWQANNRDIPEFWIAKRWSSTPETHMRIVAEYRETAPMCMREQLGAVMRKDPRGAGMPDGKELWRNCAEEIQAFSDRADGAFLFDRVMQTLPAEGTGLLMLPRANPDMERLVGKAEYGGSVSTGTGD